MRQMNEEIEQLQSENAKLHQIARYYADADDVGAYARMVLKELEDK